MIITDVWLHLSVWEQTFWTTIIKSKFHSNLPTILKIHPTNLLLKKCGNQNPMPWKYPSAAVSARQLFVLLIVVGIFLLVIGLGGFAGLNIAKRQFESQAQNIAAVLRSGIGVADGVVTSLNAAEHADVTRTQLQSHFSNVLGNYEYVSGLGRFEEFAPNQLAVLANSFTQQDTGVEGAWYFDNEGNSRPAGSNVAQQTHLLLLK